MISPDPLRSSQPPRMLMRMAGPGGPVHHSQHVRTACVEEPPDKDASKNQKYDVEPCRVVPGDGRLGDCGGALPGNETEQPENCLDDQRGSGHGDVECGEQ